MIGMLIFTVIASALLIPLLFQNSPIAWLLLGSYVVVVLGAIVLEKRLRIYLVTQLELARQRYFLKEREIKMPSPPDMFEIFAAWLQTPTYHEGYRFLKEHQELLHPGIDVQLEIEVRRVASELQQTPRSAFEKLANEHIELLREVREHGGTAEAIRAVYSDRYGGLVLDMPPWLETIAQQFDALLDLPPQVTADARISLLLDAIDRAQGDNSIAPETMAELGGRLGDAIVVKHGDKALGQKVDDLYTMTLQVFTFAHYPRHHARIQYNLGITYAISSEGDQQDNLEQAITCYKAALQFYTHDAFPDEWTDIQGRLRSAYSRLRKLKEKSE